MELTCKQNDIVFVVAQTKDNDKEDLLLSYLQHETNNVDNYNNELTNVKRENLQNNRLYMRCFLRQLIDINPQGYNELMKCVKMYVYILSSFLTITHLLKRLVYSQSYQSNSHHYPIYFTNNQCERENIQQKLTRACE